MENKKDRENIYTKTSKTKINNKTKKTRIENWIKSGKKIKKKKKTTNKQINKTKRKCLPRFFFFIYFAKDTAEEDRTDGVMAN